MLGLLGVAATQLRFRRVWLSRKPSSVLLRLDRRMSDLGEEHVLAPFTPPWRSTCGLSIAGLS
jgi:hypothetical protein